MKTTDRILLAFLALGVWALVAMQFFAAQPVRATSTTMESEVYVTNWPGQSRVYVDNLQFPMPVYCENCN